MDPCTFPVMHTLSIGLYPFRKGLWTPAHFWTWKLCPLAYIPSGRGSGVFIHSSLHISGHGNSVCWPVSLQGGALEFLSTAPCTFLDMGTLSVGLYPSREGLWSFYPWLPAHFWTWELCPLACIPPGRGTGVFIHSSLHISGHGNSVHWPISLQGGAPEFFYPWTPAHFWTWELCPLAHIPPGRGTGVFIHRPLHISRHGNSVHWPVSLQGGAPEFLSTAPCTFPDMETPSVGLYPSTSGHWSSYPQIPAHVT